MSHTVFYPLIYYSFSLWIILALTATPTLFHLAISQTHMQHIIADNSTLCHILYVYWCTVQHFKKLLSDGEGQALTNLNCTRAWASQLFPFPLRGAPSNVPSQHVFVFDTVPHWPLTPHHLTALFHIHKSIYDTQAYPRQQRGINAAFTTMASRKY